MLGVGVEEDDTSSMSDPFGSAVVNVGGSVEPDPRMAVVVVVPTEESSTVGTGILEASEPVGEVRSVLEGAELRFRIAIVIAHVRSAVGFGDPEVGQQVGHRFGDHG